MAIENINNNSTTAKNAGAMPLSNSPWAGKGSNEVKPMWVGADFDPFNDLEEINAILLKNANGTGEGTGSGSGEGSGSGSGNNNYYYSSGGGYSSVDTSQEDKDRQSANLLSKEYEKAAQDQLQSAIAAQQALAEQAKSDKANFESIVKNANATRDVANANNRKTSNDDWFTQLVSLQGVNRYMKNNTGGSYGSIDDTRNSLIGRQDANTTAEIASNLRTNMQNTNDNWVSTYNNAVSDYRTNAEKRAASQSEINREYAQGISNLASSFYSGVSGLSTEDVRNEWIDEDGNRLNEADWMKYGNMSNRPDDLYETTEWTKDNYDYQKPQRVGNLISNQAHNDVYNQYKNKKDNWSKLYQ